MYAKVKVIYISVEKDPWPVAKVTLLLCLTRLPRGRDDSICIVSGRELCPVHQQKLRHDVTGTKYNVLLSDGISVSR